jgi:general secretion pathway protein D
MNLVPGACAVLAICLCAAATHAHDMADPASRPAGNSASPAHALSGPQTADEPLPQAAPRVRYFEAAGRPASLDVEAATPDDPADRVELNFQDTNVRAVIDAVLGDILRLNYAVSPHVQGKLTLKTGHPVARSALLSVLEAALASSAVAMVQTGAVLHVVPADEAPSRARGAYLAGDGAALLPGHAVEVMPLRFIHPHEMRTILESFLPKGVVLHADAVHRHLVVAGSSPDRAAVARTVAAFDADWLQGMSFALYRLENSRPESVIAELRSIFQLPQDLFATRVRLVPLARARAVLGVARLKSDLRLVETWIGRLDADHGAERRIFVYPVQNGHAKDLAASLRQVFAEAAPAAAPAAPAATAAAADPAAAPGAGPPASRIVAIAENNSLLFHGTQDEFRLMKDALQQIDAPPLQVLIEATLAEVTLDDNLRHGVQWFLDSDRHSASFSASDSGAVAPRFPGFSYVVASGLDARLVLTALAARTEVRVLSAPKLAVLNNQKATLQVGDQVPIVTQTSQSTLDRDAAVVSTVQMRDTGVILEVTPRVNDNGNVILEVMQEVSEVARTTSSGIDSPTIQKRKVQTVVATRDGRTVALGGLIRENGARSSTGVPILKDIPGIGRLFRVDASDARRTELVVVLVPRVMRDASQTQAAVEALLQGLGGAAQLLERGDDAAPAPRE